MTILLILRKRNAPVILEAIAKTEISCIIHTERLENMDDAKRADFLDTIRQAEAIIIESGLVSIDKTIETAIMSRYHQIPVLILGASIQPTPDSILTSVQQELCNQYFIYGGPENLSLLLRYLQALATHAEETIPSPIPVPRQRIWHPEDEQVFRSYEQYSVMLKGETRGTIGLLIDHCHWASGNLAVERVLIQSLEDQNLRVIPVFTDALTDPSYGSIGIKESITEFLLDGETPRVDAIINLLSVVTDPFDPVDERREPFRMSKDLIKEINIPVFQPIAAFHQSLEEWRALKGLVDDVPWAVSLPEYDGVIEPVMIGTTFEKKGDDGTRIAIPERCDRVARRISRWVRLKNTPKSERKVVFMLNNNPCHGVEATVGGAGHMNGLESMVKLLRRLADEGYTVTDIPEDGQALIKMILERRAFCEFRWTTVEDIVVKGGAIAQITPEEYHTWYDTLNPEFREKVESLWGVPPGLGMVHDGKMLITGIRFGNALVCCQPKRGCYGPKCDGKVCKILHDPLCPPPHQYLATYHYIQEDFNADVLIHVGTHGTLELTPGKGVGMSSACSPDVCIGDIPYLYIYCSNNPPEGALAKRRTYATLIDYMLSVMDHSQLYERLEDLENMLVEYETVSENPARRHAIEHMVRDLVKEINLDSDMHLSETDSFDVLKGKAHEVLSKIRNTQIGRASHIFGEIPEEESLVEFVNNIVRFDIGDMCIRRVIAENLGLDFDELLGHQDQFSHKYGKSYGALIEDLDERAKDFIRMTIEDPGSDLRTVFEKPLSKDQADKFRLIQMRILDIHERLEQSKEIEALLNGMEMGHTPPGPSGYLSRGQDEILPTGRNFYTTDPYKTPTKSAWIVGKNLANSLLDRYMKEEGRLPENVGYFWMAMDMMCSDGEGFAQLFHLIGVEPVWNAAGQVKTFRIVPLEELKRPRIDLTIEITSTLRDCYPTSYELMDEAIRTVASLDEPIEMNYIRKHALMAQEHTGDDWRNATLRIFSNPPGAYVTGVALAVHASAWENDKDLVDIFMATHAFAYGKEYAGKLKPEQFARNLATVDVTFDKTASDTCDLLGCCCFFGNHGGMTLAARHFNPNEVKSYYGDTREPEHVYVHDMADEVRRVMRAKMFNPKWIERIKKSGYQGGTAIATRTEHLMGWQAATGEIDHWIFDEIASKFVLDPEMKEFFQEKNPYAFEELTRRLLEANQRELWDADPEVLEGLKNTYLEVESWLEDEVGEGDHQGGNVDIIPARDVEGWGESIKAIADKIDPKDLYHYLSFGRNH